MKKENILGLFSLMFLVVVFSVFLNMLGSVRNDTAFEMGGVVHTAGLIVCILIITTVFFAIKGHRLRMALMIAVGGAGGILLAWLNMPAWKECVLVGGVLLVFLAGCVLKNQRHYVKAIRMLNAAVEAYQKDRDGEAFLTTLDDCEPLFPASATVRSQEAGLITFREHLACERLRVLDDMGRQDERQTLLERLRQETKSPDFLTWLENQK